SRYLAIPQAWSIGTEIWFYLLAPALVAVRSRWLAATALVALGIRFTFTATTLPFFPWQQRFFPAELFFFILGILAFRALRRRTPSPLVGYSGLGLLIAACIFWGWLPWGESLSAFGS